MEVRTTQALAGDVVVHVGRVVDGYIAQGDPVRAEVDAPTRQATMRHHTATHLLHAALRAELGEHVHQAGSLVAPDRLRFDFSHGDALSPEQRRAVERRVNAGVRRDLPVQTEVMPLEQALQAGAIALFDEKYGETARVLTIGDVSRELCGGTHVRQTGEIGSFVLTGESSVGSGMRRIEALAGAAAEEYIAQQIDQLDAVAHAVGASRGGAAVRVRQLLAELAEARRTAAAAVRQASQGSLEDLLDGRSRSWRRRYRRRAHRRSNACARCRIGCATSWRARACSYWHRCPRAGRPNCWRPSPRTWLRAVPTQASCSQRSAAPWMPAPAAGPRWRRVGAGTRPASLPPSHMDAS
jgi:alanyl-tRNA synthetase